jgi:hypothetical protein
MQHIIGFVVSIALGLILGAFDYAFALHFHVPSGILCFAVTALVCVRFSRRYQL